MNRSITIVCLIAAFVVSGCGTGRAPEFKLSEQSQELADFAQDAMRDELQAGFGTPSSLVVWPQLEVDFGRYSGIVEKVGPRPGTVRLAAGEAAGGLEPVSELADESRLQKLHGAAVVVVPAETEASEKESTETETDGEQAAADDSAENAEATAGQTEDTAYRVASYDPESRVLSIVDSQGQPAEVDASEGDVIQVVGDALQHGRNLYLRHCMHCHGVSGDGQGPTAKYFNVKPRDYRRGIFKFTSTKASVPQPSREDIFRIVKLGVPGTYMPSFMLLPDEDVWALGEYVRWLSMRGQMERNLNAELSLDYSKEAVAEMSRREAREAFEDMWASMGSDLITGLAEELERKWSEAELEGNGVVPSVPRVEPDAESIERGRKLFLGDKAKCASCHGEAAEGNGPSTESYNDLPGQPGVKSDKPGLFDIWGNIVKPRNLKKGIYRGGRRPVDIYRRVHSGIKGTPMQAFGTTLEEEQIWDLVNYVLSIPYGSQSGGPAGSSAIP